MISLNDDSIFVVRWNKKDPDLFIDTPFFSTEEKARRYIELSGILEGEDTSKYDVVERNVDWILNKMENCYKEYKKADEEGKRQIIKKLDDDPFYMDYSEAAFEEEYNG